MGARSRLPRGAETHQAPVTFSPSLAPFVSNLPGSRCLLRVSASPPGNPFRSHGLQPGLNGDGGRSFAPANCHPPGVGAPRQLPWAQGSGP